MFGKKYSFRLDPVHGSLVSSLFYTIVILIHSDQILRCLNLNLLQNVIVSCNLIKEITDYKEYKLNGQNIDVFSLKEKNWCHQNSKNLDELSNTHSNYYSKNCIPLLSIFNSSNAKNYRFKGIFSPDHLRSNFYSKNYITYNSSQKSKNYHILPNISFIKSIYYHDNERNTNLLGYNCKNKIKNCLSINKVESNANSRRQSILFPYLHLLCAKKKHENMTKSNQNQTKDKNITNSTMENKADYFMLDNEEMDNSDDPEFITTADFKKNFAIEIDHVPFKILSFQNVKIARGAAFYRTKLRNLLNGSFLDYSFRSGEKVKCAQIKIKDVIFSYDDGMGNYVFQDTKNWHELSVAKKVIEEYLHYIKMEVNLKVKLWNDRVIDISLPTTVDYLVISASEQQHISSSSRRQVILETGLQVVVPSYISVGDRIVINTNSGEFVKKAI